MQSVIIQDFEAVYDGRYSIQEEISANLERYARQDKLRSLGVTTKIVVSTKKGKLNIFEAIFSYSGRIYFRKKDNNKMEIVAIGTRNTQEQDIAFMEGIA